MNYVGDYSAGSTVYIYFNTFDSNDPSASVTITNFINTDVHIHKNDDLVQRNNAAGITVDVDVDGITGSHFIKIDTADNTVADFFVSGADYFVRIEGTTVDAATINAVVGSFSIENRHVAGSMLRTTIATLASQTSFTLTAGSADSDAYEKCTIIISGIASAIQKAVGIISVYEGSTRTVTLAANPGIFTMAVGDQVHIIATSALANVNSWLGTQVASPSVAGIPEVDLTHWRGSVPFTLIGSFLQVTLERWRGSTPNSLSSGRVDVGLSAISGDSVAADNLEADYDGTGYNKSASTIGTTTVNTDMRGTDGANTTTPPTAAANADQVWDEAQADHVAAGSMGEMASEAGEILADTGTDGVLLSMAQTLPGSPTDDTVGDALKQASRIPEGIQRNTALSDFEFVMYNSTDNVTPITGRTVSGTRSIDGAAFAAVDGAFAEVGDGVYQFDALAADTNGTLITWRFTATGADDVFITFKTTS